MNIRLERVASLLQRAISQILEREMNDPRITGMVSVTRVDVSPDLRNAKVFITVMPADGARRAVHALRTASNWIRRRSMQLVDLRQIPFLEFLFDEAYVHEIQVLSAIEQGMARERQRRAELGLPELPATPLSAAAASVAGEALALAAEADDSPVSTLIAGGDEDDDFDDDFDDDDDDEDDEDQDEEFEEAFDEDEEDDDEEDWEEDEDEAP